MTQRPHDRSSQDDHSEPRAGTAITEEAPDDVPRTETATTGGDSTVGTGSALALGCIGGTLLLILLGLVFLAVTVLLQ